MRKHIQPEAWKTLESSFLGLRFGWRSRVSHSLSLDNNSSQLCWKEGSVQIWAGIEFTDLMSKVLGNGNKYIPYLLVTFSSVQLLSHVWLCNHMDCSIPGFPITNSQNLLKLISIESVMPSNHLILCHPLLPSIFPRIWVFSNESVLHIRWPKYWSFSISLSNEYLGLISFRIDWFDLAVQGTLKSLFQHHSQKHQFFGTKLSLWSNSHICIWLLEEP